MQEHLLRATAAAAAAGLTRDGDERPGDDAGLERGGQEQQATGNACSPVSPWRKTIDDRAQRKREYKTRREQTRRAATLVQVRLFLVPRLLVM